jgi:hypothetical protein
MSRLLGAYIETSKAPLIPSYLEYDKFYPSRSSEHTIDGNVFMSLYIADLDDTMFTSCTNTPHLNSGSFTLVYSNR